MKNLDRKKNDGTSTAPFAQWRKVRSVTSTKSLRDKACAETQLTASEFEKRFDKRTYILLKTKDHVKNLKPKVSMNYSFSKPRSDERSYETYRSPSPRNKLALASGPTPP